jgi:hypothetical protein
MHRMMVDQRVFSRKKKELGGAVLIDQSGSMQMDGKDVEKIVEAAPAVVVGAYAGSGDYGEFRMLAHKGKRVADEHLFIPHGGNQCDYPALVWLSQQPEPRIWVSDGEVFGTGGSRAEQMRDCVEICRKHRIVRIDSPEEAVEFLGKLK